MAAVGFKGFNKFYSTAGEVTGLLLMTITDKYHKNEPFLLMKCIQRYV